MDTNKKLILLFIYYLIFISSFYTLFQLKRYMRDASGEIIFSILGKKIILHSITEALNLKIVLYLICIVSFLASLAMIYLAISYNFDVIHEKKLIEEAAQKIKEIKK